MSEPNPICPCCNKLPKNPTVGYCNPCNRAKHKARRKAKSFGKPKQIGWASFR